MARPKLFGDVVIYVRLCADDETKFMSMADDRGLSRSEMARELIHKALK